MITNEQINYITTRIADSYHPDKIILFGSCATGNQKEDSDVDLIVVKQSDKPKNKRGIEIRRLFYGLLLPLDIKVYTPDEFSHELDNDYSFLSSAIKTSKVVYER